MAKVFLKYYRGNSISLHVLEVSTDSRIPCFFYPAMTGNSSPLLKTARVVYCCSVQEYRECTQARLNQEDSVAYALREYWKTLSIEYFRAFVSLEFVIHKMSSSLLCYSGNLLRGNEQEIWHYFQHHSPQLFLNHSTKIFSHSMIYAACALVHFLMTQNFKRPL